MGQWESPVSGSTLVKWEGGEVNGGSFVWGGTQNKDMELSGQVI